MLSFSLVASLLAADVALPEEVDSFDAFPLVEFGIPENGRLLVSGGTRFLVTHRDGSVEELTGEDPVFNMHTRSYFTVTPTLVEGDTITLERVCEGCANDLPFTWAVGPADNDAPAFTDGPSTDGGVVGLYDNDPELLNNYRYGFNVGVWLPPLETPEMTVVHVVGEGVDAHQVAFHDDFGPFVTFQVLGPEEREACFQATAIDPAGNESTPSSFCVDLVDDRRPFGCAQGDASLWSLAALGAVGLRRRRWSTHSTI